MEPALKKVAIALAVALILVLGLIALSAGSRKQTVATVKTGETSQSQTENNQADMMPQPTADIRPDDEATASEADAANEAQDNQTDDAAQEDEIYEGALAGLSEEEIAKMALAEEGSAKRTEETGNENAID